MKLSILLLLSMGIGQAKLTTGTVVPVVAGFTTTLANLSTIISSVRHPKVATKKVAKKIKEAVKK